MGKIGAVLTGDAADESAFGGHVWWLASGGLAKGLRRRGGVGVVEGFDGEGEGMEAVFEVGEAGLEGGAGGVEEGGGFVEHVVDGGADKFGDVAEAAGEAELAETLVFLGGEAEADHARAGFGGHWGRGERRFRGFRE